MSSKPVDEKELRLKIVAAVGAALAFVIGLWQYRDTKQKEFHAKFWDQRAAIYQRASAAASALAIVGSAEESLESRRNFWRLYYGEMSLVEDEQVKTAMECFAEGLRHIQAGSPPNLLTEPAFELTIVLRQSLKYSWNHPFDFSGPPDATAEEVCNSVRQQEWTDLNDPAEKLNR